MCLRMRSSPISPLTTSRKCHLLHLTDDSHRLPTSDTHGPNAVAGDDLERVMDSGGHDRMHSTPSRSEKDFAQMQGLQFVPVTTVHKLTLDEIRLFKDLYGEYVTSGQKGASLQAKEMVRPMSVCAYTRCDSPSTCLLVFQAASLTPGITGCLFYHACTCTCAQC